MLVSKKKKNWIHNQGARVFMSAKKRFLFFIYNFHSLPLSLEALIKGIIRKLVYIYIETLESKQNKILFTCCSVYIHLYKYPYINLLQINCSNLSKGRIKNCIFITHYFGDIDKTFSFFALAFSTLNVFVCYQDNLAQKKNDMEVCEPQWLKNYVFFRSVSFFSSFLFIRRSLFRINVLCPHFCVHTLSTQQNFHFQLIGISFEYKMNENFLLLLLVLLLLLRLKLYTSFPNCIFCVCLIMSVYSSSNSIHEKKIFFYEEKICLLVH